MVAAPAANVSPAPVANPGTFHCRSGPHHGGLFCDHVIECHEKEGREILREFFCWSGGGFYCSNKLTRLIYVEDSHLLNFDLMHSIGCRYITVVM